MVWKCNCTLFTLNQGFYRHINHKDYQLQSTLIGLNSNFKKSFRTFTFILKLLCLAEVISLYIYFGKYMVSVLFLKEFSVAMNLFVY